MENTEENVQMRKRIKKIKRQSRDQDGGERERERDVE